MTCTDVISGTRTIAISYHNLGGYLYKYSGDSLAGFLAAALIRRLAGINGTGAKAPESSVRRAAALLAVFGSHIDPPSNVADLCDRLADLPGTDLPRLITRLAPDAPTAADAARPDRPCTSRGWSS